MREGCKLSTGIQPFCGACAVRIAKRCYLCSSGKEAFGSFCKRLQTQTPSGTLTPHDKGKIHSFVSSYQMASLGEEMNVDGPGPALGRQVIDKQVYQQVAASRNRLSQQLSSRNKYIRHLERTLDHQYQALADTHTALLRVHKELEALKRLSEVAVAAAAYGVDKSDTVARSQRLVERAASLQKGIDKEAKELDQLVMRRIPIAWYGVASDVKLLGDFDSWTRGFSLSRGEIQDQTFTKFSAVITLLPGRYLVKFKIDDNHWRLAPDWPTNDSPDGNTNNVLVVA